LRENIILQSTHCVFHAKVATIAKRGSTSLAGGPGLNTEGTTKNAKGTMKNEK
jgi:hypothetical protein